MLKRHCQKKICFICFSKGPLKTIKVAFDSSLKVLFVLKMFNFFPHFFSHVGKRHYKKAKVNFQIYVVTYWEANNYNKHSLPFIHN